MSDEKMNFLSKYSFSVSQLEKIFENSHDGLFVTDESANLIFVNKPAAKHLGKTPEEILGRNVKEFLSKKLYNRSAVLQAMKTQKPATLLVETITGNNSLSTSIPIIENGKVVMTITNIRNTKTIESYIKELEKEKQTSKLYKTTANYLNFAYSGNKEIIANSQKMKAILKGVDNISESDCSVLLQGESGTGKEIIASLIHRTSNRASEPFIPVNCSAIPNNLMESEFFGYEKGAFTGARDQGKPGLFELANKGTLFLDEIGDLPYHMQSKLLRVLENGIFQRLGGTEYIKTNVRIISATNKKLLNLIDTHEFREDLFYRISVMPFHLPPLRKRPKDIIALAEHFLEILNEKYGKNKYFHSELLDKLLHYSWPGNIRELKNVVERIYLVTPGNKIHLQEEFFRFIPIDKSKNNPYLNKKDKPLKDVMEDIEKDFIVKTLDSVDGRINEAAEQLGIHRTMLYKKMKKYGIEKENYK